MPRKSPPSKTPGVAARRNLDFAAADAAATATTPSTPTESVRASTRKRATEAPVVTSPLKRKKTTVAAVTPDDEDEAKREQEQKDLSSFVPKFIHANVAYKTRGQAVLSQPTRTVFQWIQENYEIPIDLEQRRSYGPLSGSAYETRVIQQYDLGTLRLKQQQPERKNDDGESMDVMCTCCAELGHKRNDCPTLV